MCQEKALQGLPEVLGLEREPNGMKDSLGPLTARATETTRNRKTKRLFIFEEGRKGSSGLISVASALGARGPFYRNQQLQPRETRAGHHQQGVATKAVGPVRLPHAVDEGFSH